MEKQKPKPNNKPTTEAKPKAKRVVKTDAEVLKEALAIQKNPMLAMTPRQRELLQANAKVQKAKAINREVNAALKVTVLNASGDLACTINGKHADLIASMTLSSYGIKNAITKGYNMAIVKPDATEISFYHSVKDKNGWKNAMATVVDVKDTFGVVAYTHGSMSYTEKVRKAVDYAHKLGYAIYYSDKYQNTRMVLDGQTILDTKKSDYEAKSEEYIIGIVRAMIFTKKDSEFFTMNLVARELAVKYILSTLGIKYSPMVSLDHVPYALAEKVGKCIAPIF